MNPLYMWLIAGIVLVLAEIVGPGIGLLFAGLGALTTGILLQLGFVAADDILMQLIVFCAFTAFWAIALWKLVRRAYRARKDGYSNMIGERAVVAAGGLARGSLGEVAWSGTHMRAELADDAVETSLPAGSPVTIVAVKGTVLIVKPQNHA